MPVPAPSELPDPDVLAHRLRQRLPTWSDVRWTSSTGSTNTDLVAAARAGAELPRLLGTDEQTGGRGRANRNFRTEPGDALMFSCAFDTPLPAAALPTLSVRLGLAACEALAARLYVGHRLCLKWPNDLQWGDAKLAGILMESAGFTRSGSRLVIGIGINLQGAARLSKTLGRAVADWDATGWPVAREVLCASVAAAWHDALRDAQDEWQPGVGLPGLPARFAAFDALAGKAVNVLQDGVVQRQGIALGVAADGQLRLQDEAGAFLVNVGDISVRTQPDAADATSPSPRDMTASDSAASANAQAAPGAARPQPDRDPAPVLQASGSTKAGRP